MLLTIANKNAAIALVENNPPNAAAFPAATRQRVLNSTVKLYGTGADKVSNFVGTGVIYNVDATYAYLLTAAHNVMAWASLKAPPANWNNYVPNFATAITIAYGAADLAFNSAPTGTAKVYNATIPAIQGLCNGQANCIYDLLVLTSKDSALRAYAKNSVFSGQQNTFQQEAQQIYGSDVSLLDPGGYHHVQLGYGKTKDDRKKEYIENGVIKQEDVWWEYCQQGTNITANALQYRLATPSFKAFKTYYQQIAAAGQAPVYNQYVAAISLVGKASSTTAEGDSGGPLFAVDKKTRSNAYLIGLTTGADMEPAQKPASWIYKNVISASLVPYCKFYLGIP